MIARIGRVGRCAASSAIKAWYGCDSLERRAMGRFALLALVLVTTHSALSAMALWAVLDYLLEGENQ